MISNLSRATQLVSVEGRVQTQVRLCLTAHASSLSVPPLKSTSLTLLSQDMFSSVTCGQIGSTSDLTGPKSESTPQKLLFFVSDPN